MDIIFGIVRHVIIDDHADILDVDTACDDVRRYENPHFIILKIEHHLLAFLLIQIGVHVVIYISFWRKEAPSISADS